jgi:flagellar basal-body rod modification protein FlgD
MTTIYGPLGTLSTSAAPAASTSPAAPAKDPNAVDHDMFLKLLVAQLKYQDPSSPTDPTQFLSQTAQFTTVEKLNQISDLSQKVFDASREQTATSMIGRAVTWTDVAGKEHTGTVTGVSVGASTPNLTVDGEPVSLDAVSAVASR